ncbi:hypothetical protein ACGFXC_12700 [Streptomyces sp. NPDC048507]|uniref:hypothetical protein n=1 Tax=Streptomyces sp. NPDC048507 TaxID=3365560 RepID=UPI003716C6E7
MSPAHFDWLQAADRHTELTDPVISVRQLARWDLRRKRHTHFDHCLVYATHEGDHVEFRPPRRPRATTRYSAVYEVDLGVHLVRDEVALPSSNDALEFQAEAEFRWQVADPVAFVRSGERDVPRLLRNELERRSRDLVRLHAVTDSAVAEAELLRSAAGWPQLGAAAGLTTSWTLRLRRNQQAIAHQIRLQAIGQEAEAKILGDVLGRDTDAAAEQREAALLRLQSEKVGLYEDYLEQGGIRASAWYLSRHPGAGQEVMANLREDQRQLVEKQLELVTKLFDSAEAETHELAEPRRHAVRALTEVLTQRFPGTSTDAGGSAADGPPTRDLPPGYGRTPVDPAEG